VIRDLWVQFVSAWQETSGIEILAAVLAVLYLVLAIRQRLSCWVAAFISSCLYVWVFYGAHLYMESMLNAFYAAMAVYGFRQWQRGRGGAALVVCRWPIAPHLAGVLGIAVLSWVSSYFLRRYTPAAWPLVDSMVTWSSVFATFLVARKVYENWHWWLVIDSVSLCLYFTKHLYLTTLLFGLYLVLIVLGMRQWRNSLLSTASTAGPAGTHAAGHARAHARG
jgi:nicotinamide mononucleotide transporter